MSGLICRIFPVPSLMKVKERRPRLSPVAMLNVKGVATIVRNAGKRFGEIVPATLARIRTSARRPESARAQWHKWESAATSGEQNIAATKTPRSATLPNPVRAPAATPAALSM